MKFLTIILAAVMGFMALFGGASAALNKRETEEFNALAAKLAAHGVPDDVIESMFGMLAKRALDTTTTVCPSSVPGVPTGTETPVATASSAPGQPVSSPSDTATPNAGVTPTVTPTETPGTGSTPPAVPGTESAPPAGPPAATPSPAPPASNGPPSGLGNNSTTITTSTPTSTASVPTSTETATTPPAVGGASVLKMNLAAIGVAALAAFY
ncbi:uncharacterized protein AB675_10172 [Cyphellophora attinorum]|uniref:Uncharacterized protein n=1 Tax=Cyphellophora attinorum TaxID=1664694 RepID=A0A0N0NHY0_9EURO|nr:uncharacterized protein AB675_10172 [Phialophora attinorum]KPI35201.1 hypothetical protein AB675_10172 [Phialophora attinorum]